MRPYLFVILIVNTMLLCPSYGARLQFSPPKTLLSEKIRNAEAGDFIAIGQQKHISFLRIHTKTPDSVILEEITFPSRKLKGKYKHDWKKLLSDGAPYHTSWTLIEFSLHPNVEITEAYSVTKESWLKISEKGSLLYNLFTQPALLLDKDKQKKIGPKPPGGPDMRKVWNPPLVKEGIKQSGAKFDVYRIQWSHDNSPLHGKNLDFYFDKSNPSFPFPYFSRISDEALASMQFSVVDSGVGLLTNRRELPRRPIQMITKPQWDNKGLKLTLFAPSYYKKFTLSALNPYEKEAASILLDPKKIERQDEHVTLFFDKDTFESLLKKKNPYSLTLFTEHPTAYFVDLPGYFTL